jgi:hypothetical protein
MKAKEYVKGEQVRIINKDEHSYFFQVGEVLDTYTLLEDTPYATPVVLVRNTSLLNWPYEKDMEFIARPGNGILRDGEPVPPEYDGVTWRDRALSPIPAEGGASRIEQINMLDTDFFARCEKGPQPC